MIKENERQLEGTPKTLSVRESLYIDSIKRDFPELNLDLVKTYVNELVANYLKCLETGDVRELKKDCTENLVAQALSRKTGQAYNQLKFHRTVVYDYRKSAAEARLIFQTACQYSVNVGTKKRRREKTVQTRFEVQYSYYLKETSRNVSEVLRCSYCGAPVEQVGVKICKYCGNGVVDTIKRTWEFSDIREF